MDALEAIRKRRSVREFTGQNVPKSDLVKIVDAGRLAASGSNRQPWNFIIITNRTMILKLKAASAWIENAGAVIAVVMDTESEWWREDASAAVENMLIASTAMGYGSCWLEGYTIPFESEFKQILKIPPNKKLFTLIPIGIPVAWPESEKKTIDEVLHWELF